MFSHTLDRRREINDWNGNTLVDLFPSVFNFKTSQIENYNVYKVSDTYVMRPDLVSLKYYGSTERTEYILLYNGISNPFSLDKDDILMVPNPAEADAQMVRDMSGTSDSLSDGFNRSIAVRNAYKYISEKKFPKPNANIVFDNKKIGDTSIKRNIKSNIDVSVSPVKLKNGKVYFESNVGLVSASEIPSSNIDAKIEKLINTALGLINPDLDQSSGSSLAGNPNSGNRPNGPDTSHTSPEGSDTGNGSPSNNLCESIGCGDNSCITGNCLSDGTTITDILKGYNTTL